MSKYHYVYLITDIEPTDSRKFYIGVRSSNVLPDLDFDYMSSSATLLECIHQRPTSFLKIILSIWPSRKEAIQEEVRLHQLYNVSKNNEFYNIVKQTTTKFDSSGEDNFFFGKSLCGEKNGFFGKTHTEKTKKHLSSIRKGKRKGKENSFFGKHHTKEAKKRIGQNGWSGKAGQKRRQKISEALTGIKHKKRTLTEPVYWLRLLCVLCRQ